MLIRTGQKTSGWWWSMVALSLIVTLLPWWRNHKDVTLFVDYGVTAAAAVRMGAGERPYVDYTTPIQSLSHGLNALAFRWGGSTYQSLTWGGAALTGLALLGLMAILRRRWSGSVAIVGAVAVVMASQGQHTIIWYNALGVICLAGATWAVAIAPVIRRSTWGWHVVALVALVLGGMNKLNFHLLAVVACLGWVFRAGLLKQASGWRVGVSALLLLVAGVGLPIGLEMAWSGASWTEWRSNVVDLPFAERTSSLGKVFTWEFLSAWELPFFGRVHLPAIGLVGLVLLGLLGARWMVASRGWNRGLVLMATAYAGVGYLLLLITNIDIAYLGLGSALALLISLGLGFSDGRPDGWTTKIVLGAALLVGGFSWEAAWTGQRSQFGTPPERRRNYVELKSGEVGYAFLQGTRIPEALAMSLEELAGRMPLPEEDGKFPVFYANGGNWLEAVWPAVTVPKLPLWMHGGVSYGPVQWALLRASIASPSRFKAIVGPPFNADGWDGMVFADIERSSLRVKCGSEFEIRRFHQGGFGYVEAVLSKNRLGGNMNPKMFTFLQPMKEQTVPDGRVMLAIVGRDGAFEFEGMASRLQGEVAILVKPPESQRELAVAVDRSARLSAVFAIQYRNDGGWAEIWSRELTLPAEGNELGFVAEAYAVDARNAHLRFVVTVDSVSADRIEAGWLAPQITHAGPPADEPPQLWADDVADVRVERSALAAAMPLNGLPDQWRLRGGKVVAGGVVLSPGGQLWMRTNRMVRELRGQARLVDGTGSAVVRSAWHKSGRLEIIQQEGMNGDATLNLRFWSPEADGWMGVFVDPGRGAASVHLRFESIEYGP